MTARGRHLRSEHGFTIVETLMAMICGLAVSAALFAVLEVSLHQTSLLTERAHGTQAGREAMALLTNEIGSACLAREFTPVQEKSSGTELRFISAYSEKPVIASSEVTEHRIVWSGKEGGPLVDESYKATGGTWPEFTFATEKPGKRLLAEHVWRIPTGEKGQYYPIFQYYKYAGKATTGSAEAAQALEQLTYTESGSEAKGLGKAEAKSAASVLIRLGASQLSGETALELKKVKESRRIAEFQDQMTFAFSAPAAEATVKSGPCQ